MSNTPASHYFEPRPARTVPHPAEVIARPPFIERNGQLIVVIIGATVFGFAAALAVIAAVLS